MINAAVALALVAAVGAGFIGGLTVTCVLVAMSDRERRWKGTD